jgi:glycerate 2-kinase
MRILVAPDKFKGSLTATAVASAVRRGLLLTLPELEVTCLPIADGGDGTLDVAVAAGHERVSVTAQGPTGAPVETGYARRGSTAVVELADVSGLARLPHGELRPMDATSRGTGEVVAAAIEAGCHTIVLGVGGSASTDGGAGMLQSLGARLLDADGHSIGPGGTVLQTLATVDLAQLRQRLDGVELVVASDVDNPLTGPHGAAAVYGPQKGAGPDQVELLERCLTHWADLAEEATGRKARDVPGAGAAGGVGFGALVAGATIRSGAALVLELVGLADQLTDVDAVVIGEGSLDSQTLRGKGPAGVARAARDAGARVLAVCGRNLLTPDRVEQAGIQRVYALSDLEPDPQRSMTNAEALLETVGAQIARDLTA